jgi:hypothetical protein
MIGGDIAQEFLHAVLSEARQQRCLSDEQFVVDGTLIEAWASRKSYQPKGDPPALGQGSGRDWPVTEARSVPIPDGSIGRSWQTHLRTLVYNLDRLALDGAIQNLKEVLPHHSRSHHNPSPTHGLYDNRTYGISRTTARSNA